MQWRIKIFISNIELMQKCPFKFADTSKVSGRIIGNQKLPIEGYY